MFALKYHEQIPASHFINSAGAFCKNSYYTKSHACLLIYLRFPFSSQSISWSSFKCLSLWNRERGVQSYLISLPSHLPLCTVLQLLLISEYFLPPLIITFNVFCFISILSPKTQCKILFSVFPWNSPYAILCIVLFLN